MTGRGIAEAGLGVMAVFLAAGAVVVGVDEVPGRNAAILAAVLGVVFLATVVRRPARGPADGRPPGSEPWWLGVMVPPGATTWASFLYLGMRTARRSWLAWSAAYLAAFAAGLVLNLIRRDEEPTLGTIASLLWGAVYFGGMLHAFLIRDRARDDLALAAMRRPGRADDEEAVHTHKDLALIEAADRGRAPFSPKERGVSAVSIIGAFAFLALGMPWFAVAAMVPSLLMLREYDKRTSR